MSVEKDKTEIAVDTVDRGPSGPSTHELKGESDDTALPKMTDDSSYIIHTDKSGSASATEITPPPSPDVGERSEEIATTTSQPSTSSLLEDMKIDVKVEEAAYSGAEDSDDDEDDSKVQTTESSVGLKGEILLEPADGGPLISLPREYATVNEDRELDINNLEITVESTKAWKVFQRIGKGTYSEVFEGRNTTTGETACVKILKPCKPQLLKMEIYILEQLRSGPNIIRLLHTLQDPRSELFCLVFEILEAREFKDLISELTDEDMRYYLFQMLQGLDYAHSCGIMHRDVKPQNILVDTKSRQVRVIDWGIAAFYFPGHKYTPLVATRSYKAPELLVGYQTYHYAIDVWAFGCMLGAIIFQKNYFFHGTSAEGDQLHTIVKVKGTDVFNAFMDKYRVDAPPYCADWPHYPARDWSDFLSDTSEKNKFVTKNALDLLDRMLKFDPAERCTMAEAMEHPYFDKVRSRIAAMDGSKSSSDSGADFGAGERTRPKMGLSASVDTRRETPSKKVVTFSPEPVTVTTPSGDKADYEDGGGGRRRSDVGSRGSGGGGGGEGDGLLSARSSDTLTETRSTKSVGDVESLSGGASSGSPSESESPMPSPLLTGSEVKSKKMTVVEEKID